MWFALRTLLFERKRYWAGVMAVAFSVVLIAVQIGLVHGLMSMVSFPVDLSIADVWVAAPKVRSCDLGGVMNRDFLGRLIVRPEVKRAEEYIQGFTFWKHPAVGEALVIVAGCRLDDETIGPAQRVPAELRQLLSEPGAVLINLKDKKKLGIENVGELATIFGNRVRVVGFTTKMASFTGPYVMCSLRTARQLLVMEENRTTYLLASCKDPKLAESLVQDLRQTGKVSAFTSPEFSSKSRWYWIENTNAGVAIGFVALLGLTVGAVITSQTLYGAVIASLRELMVLRALGIPRWRMVVYVLWQAFFVGLLGLLVGIPVSFLVGALGEAAGTKPILDSWLMVFTSLISLITALFAGFIALRSLKSVEPVQLLR